MKIFLLVLFLLTLAACGSKQANNCDKTASGGSLLGSTTYDCPSGDPNPADLEVSTLSGLSDIEAGSNYTGIVSVKNLGTAKIFDFGISSSQNIVISQNTCPTKLYQNDTCSFVVNISETVAGSKNGKLNFVDRTNKLNKSIDLNYIIKPSNPVSIEQKTFEVDYKTKRVELGPLIDRFGNKSIDEYQVSTNRSLSTTGIMPFLSQTLSLVSNGAGIISFYVQTDQLEGTLVFDNADISMLSTRIFSNGSTSSKNFSLTFINNKPSLSNVVQNFSIDENSLTNPITGLLEGEDKRNKPLNYRLITKPSNGVIHNCLNGLNFISLYNCSYTPNKNFNGTDSFSYVVNNGDADSINIATVNIIVGHKNVAPILSGTKSFKIKQDESFSLNLVQAFDADGDVLTYVLTQNPIHGVINCSSFTCLYVPQTGYIGSDSLKYKARDVLGLESQEYLITFDIIAVNHAPILGGSISYNTIENQAIVFTLPSGSDQDAGDSLVYRIKTNTSKGQLTGCLGDTANLTCTYTPNIYENTSEIFSYVAVDSKGVESVPKLVTINIGQVNSAPYFSNLYQEEQVLPNGSVNFALSNAIDPEGNSINYILVNSLPANGGLLSSCLISNNLNCSYSAPAGITSGSYTFQYKAQDSLGLDSYLRTVKMVIGTTNSQPTLSGVLSVTTLEDTTVAFSLLPGSDVETPQAFLRYKIGSIKPTKGILSKCADLVDSSGLSDITCEYKPLLNQNGTDSFSYYVIDGRNNQSTELTVTINITPVNDKPVFDLSTEQISVNESQSVTFTINPAIDPENDLISYSIKPGGNPANGILSPNCISTVGQLNNCVYTPNQNYNGTDSFTIIATDPYGSFSEKTYNIIINPVNNAPYFSNYQIGRSVLEDGDNMINLDEASDIDSPTDAISYTIVSLPTKGLISGCLMINNMKGLNCLYLPYSNEQGLDSFSYKANDGISDSAVVTVNLTIVPTNDLPFFEKTKIGPISVARGDSVSFNLNTAKDVENDAITYQIVSSPGNGVLSNCFTGNPLSCTYTASIDFIGEDSFVYRAKDSSNSINTVQVNFTVGDKKNDRIFKIKNKAGIDFAQKQSISVDKNVYVLGKNILMNMANPSNAYFSNSTYIKYPDGEMKQILSSPLTNFKTVKDSNTMYSFDETSAGNFLRIIDKEGNIQSLPYSLNTNIFYPKLFNNNIYTGSNRSTLYKVNLMKIGTNNYSWIEPIVSKEMLGVSSTSKLIEIIGSLNNELYFTFIDDNNLKKLAKIKTNDSLEIITTAFPIIQDIFLYDNGSTKKVFFTAGSSSSKKIYSYNTLAISSVNKLTTVVSSDYIPNTIINPKIFHAISGDVIVYSDLINSKIAGLDPFVDKIIEYDIQNIQSAIVSKLANKLGILKNDGSISVYSDNPILGLSTNIQGILGQQLYSFFDDSFVVKKQNIDEMDFIDDTNNLVVNYQDSFVYSDNFVSDGNRIFGYKQRATLNGSVFELFEYKRDLLLSARKGKLNKIEGLFVDSQATGYSVSAAKLPSFGTLNNCMGINSTGLVTDCEYTPNPGFSGLDSFKYTINKNGVTKEYLVKISVDNTKPTIIEKVDVSDQFSVNNLNGEITDYVVYNDEIFFSLKRTSNGYVYRYNKAEGLKLIEKNNKGFFGLKVSNNFLYYIDQGNSNKIKFFDIASKYNGIVFDDSTQSPTLIINDIIINNNTIFAIIKNYGSTLINRMARINISDFHFDLSAMPANYENGKFIKLGLNIGIEIENKFSMYNEGLDSFTNTITTGETISIGRTNDNADSQPVFELTKTNGLFTNTYFKPFDISTQQFGSGFSFSFSGATFESFLTKRFSAGVSQTGLFEVKDNTDGFSSILLYRQGLPSNDLFAQDAVNFLPIFNELDGEESSLVKQFDDKVYSIKHDSLWSYATFGRIGYDTNYYALNHSAKNIKVPGAIDIDSDVVSYLIVNQPAYGVISDCMGLNGTSPSDLDCTYTHTDNSSAVLDSFSYRAFDGYEYSDPKVISIKIRNNAPYFENNLSKSITIPINYAIDLTLDQGFDDDGNNLYYIITSIPTKGILTNCAIGISQISQSSTICHYTPNNNISGLDSFKYRVFDGMSYSPEKTMEINISQNPNPIFFTSSQQVFVPKTSAFVITLEKGLDPQGHSLTYSITQNPTNGTISNCFVISFNKLQCTYTPTNSAAKSTDSFKYIANNGTYTSAERTVNIINTGSLMTGELGSLHVTETGVSLIKNGLNNISQINTLSGYNWNSSSKILTLPANLEYNFESIVIDDNVKVIFKPFNPTNTQVTTVGWTRLYSQSACVINGTIKFTGIQTAGITDVPVNVTGIDNESLSYIIKAYSPGVFGGNSGGNSNMQKASGSYGSPTFYIGGNGQLALNDIGLESIGGNRGLDGNSVFIKCIDSISGSGIIDTSGLNGSNGTDGQSGGQDDVLRVSFGGAGGAGGGNGGQGGVIKIRTSSNNFNGNYLFNGGQGGVGGNGGIANTVYTTPYSATKGTNGQNGYTGLTGSCFVGDLTGSYSVCN